MQASAARSRAQASKALVANEVCLYQHGSYPLNALTRTAATIDAAATIAKTTTLSAASPEPAPEPAHRVNLCRSAPRRHEGGPTADPHDASQARPALPDLVYGVLIMVRGPNRYDPARWDRWPGSALLLRRPPVLGTTTDTPLINRTRSQLYGLPKARGF